MFRETCKGLDPAREGERGYQGAPQPVLSCVIKSKSSECRSGRFYNSNCSYDLSFSWHLKGSSQPRLQGALSVHANGTEPPQ